MLLRDAAPKWSQELGQTDSNTAKLFAKLLDDLVQNNSAARKRDLLLDCDWDFASFPDRELSFSIGGLCVRFADGSRVRRPSEVEIGCAVDELRKYYTE